MGGWGSWHISDELPFLQLCFFGFFSYNWSFFYLQLALSCLQWEGVSKKHLNRLQAEKLSCNQKAPTVSKQASAFLGCPLPTVPFFVSTDGKGCEGQKVPQGGPNPVFLNPVFQGSSYIHCAVLHELTLARKLHDFPEL